MSKTFHFSSFRSAKTGAGTAFFISVSACFRVPWLFVQKAVLYNGSTSFLSARGKK